MASIVNALADESVERTKTHPYQQVLLHDECTKLEKLEQKLHKKLDDVLHLWVHDSADAGNEPRFVFVGNRIILGVLRHCLCRQPFLLRVKPTTPVGEIRVSGRHQTIDVDDAS